MFFVQLLADGQHQPQIVLEVGIQPHLHIEPVQVAQDQLSGLQTDGGYVPSWLRPARSKWPPLKRR